MSQYSETIGSFTRTGNYPLEANYIFESEDALKQFYSDPIATTTLHEGLLKIVKTGTDGKQALYWVVNGENGLEFKVLIKDLQLDNIENQLEEILEKIDEIYGTDNPSEIPEDLNSILELAQAVKDLQSKTQTIKEELKAVVGTDQDNIKEYLQSLDYKSLTELSQALNKFLNTTNSEDPSIDTWTELKNFLKGYTDQDTLSTILSNLLNNILGDPIPSESFRTLRGVEDFVRELKSRLENRDENLQTELDQTQVGVGLSSDGSYSPDQETYYLKGATSVMNALKTLDQLIHDSLQEFIINPANKDVVPLEIIKTPNGYNIGASLLLSNQQGNQLIKKSDGLYYNTKLNYEDGLVTLLINDSIISQFNIGISSILDDGYYDPETEQLVLIFNSQNDSSQTARIPVGSLIREWNPENSYSDKVVEITREEVINGADKVSADVRISEKSHNILKKDGNSLYVEGTSDTITYNNQSLTSIIQGLQDKDNTLETTKADIDSPIFTGIPQVQVSPDPTDSSQRIPSTNWVRERIDEMASQDAESYWVILESGE